MKYFLFLMAVLLATPALAQDVSGDTLANLNPIIDVVIQVVGAFLLAGGFYLSRIILAKLKLKNDEVIRGYLYTAIEHGIGFAVEKARAAGNDIKEVNVRSVLVADAADYVSRKVPDAAKHFNLNYNDLAELAQAKLGISEVEE